MPDLEKLKNIEVWVMAGSQVFFSYVICQGTATSLGSFNVFSFNSMKWTLILSGLNSGASILAGFAIFSILGNLATQLDIPITEVAEGGPGLAFIAYPRALQQLPCPALWNVLFFLMIIFLGLASQCAEVEAMVTMIGTF